MAENDRMQNRDFMVRRPVRACLIGTVALTLLTACAAPFMKDIPQKGLLIAAGAGYGALLSFGAVGVSLLSAIARRRLVWAAFGIQTLGLLFFAALLTSAFLQIEIGVGAFAFRWLLAIGKWVSLFGGLACLGVASAGWLRLWRRGRWSSGRRY